MTRVPHWHCQHGCEVRHRSSEARCPHWEKENTPLLCRLIQGTARRVLGLSHVLRSPPHPLRMLKRA